MTGDLELYLKGLYKTRINRKHIHKIFPHSAQGLVWECIICSRKFTRLDIQEDKSKFSLVPKYMVKL